VPSRALTVLALFKRDSARFRRAANRNALSLRRVATKYSFLVAINDVVNDTHSVPILLVLLSRAAVTTALLLPVNYTLYSPARRPESKLYNWTVVKTVVGQVPLFYPDLLGPPSSLLLLSHFIFSVAPSIPRWRCRDISFVINLYFFSS